MARARRAAQELYPDKTLFQGTGDVFRHCYWNALMEIRLSTKDAYEIATRHESKSKGIDKTMDLRNNSIGRGIGRKNDGKTSAGTRSKKGYLNAQKNGAVDHQERQPRQEQQVTSVFNRRVAPVLLLLQVAYIGLFAVLITILPPDTADLDHTETSALDTVFYAATLLGIVVALAGAAALLGLEKARSRTPRAVRAGGWGSSRWDKPPSPHEHCSTFSARTLARTSCSVWR